MTCVVFFFFLAMFTKMIVDGCLLLCEFCFVLYTMTFYSIRCDTVSQHNLLFLAYWLTLSIRRVIVYFLGNENKLLSW